MCQIQIRNPYSQPPGPDDKPKVLIYFLLLPPAAGAHKCTHAMSSRASARINVGTFVHSRSNRTPRPCGELSLSSQLMIVMIIWRRQPSVGRGAREIMNRQPLIRQTIDPMQAHRARVAVVMGVSRPHCAADTEKPSSAATTTSATPSGKHTHNHTCGGCVYTVHSEVPFILWPIVSLCVCVCSGYVPASGWVEPRTSNNAGPHSSKRHQTLLTLCVRAFARMDMGGGRANGTRINCDRIDLGICRANWVD